MWTHTLDVGKDPSGTRLPSVRCWISIDVSQAFHAAPCKQRMTTEFLLRWVMVGAGGDCMVSRILGFGVRAFGCVLYECIFFLACSLYMIKIDFPFSPVH